VEQGTHDQLMAAKGKYFNLVTQQIANSEEGEGDTNQMQSISDDNSQINEDELPREQGLATLPPTVMSSEVNPLKKAQRLWLFLRLLRLNSPEGIFILVGLIAAAGFGTVNVFFAIIFGDVLTMFMDEPDIARPKSVEYGLLFAALGLGCLLTISLQGLMFGLSGERLTRRVRSKMFKAMLEQEMAWFDRKENNTGALCSRLSSTAQAVSGATGSKIGQIMQGVTTIVFSFALALHYNWKVGLVSFAFIPLLIVGMLYQMILTFKQGFVQVEALEKSAKFAVDAIKNIRTVAGLNCEKMFQSLYDNELTEPFRKTKSWSHIRGLIFGFANSSFTFAYAVTFAYGGHVYMTERTPKEVMEIWKISIAVLNGALFVGLAFSFAMDFNVAFAAAESIFQLLDRQPTITAMNILDGLDPFPAQE
jgi:ABC-type multidrug transport system fused ATPase/permease subunit